MIYDIMQLNEMLVPQLQTLAEELKVKNIKKLEKQDLVYKILDAQALLPLENNEKPKKAKTEKVVKEKTTKFSKTKFNLHSEIKDQTLRVIYLYT